MTVVTSKPGHVIDDRTEVRWTMQLNGLQCPIVRLQHALDSLAVRVCRMTVLNTSHQFIRPRASDNY